MEKKKIPALNRHEVFVYPDEKDEYILYAPFSGIVLYASAKEVEQLEQDCRAGKQSEVLSALLSVESEPVAIKGPENITELTILINNICNFSCAYCYSAKGRTKISADVVAVKEMLDYFVNPDRGDSLQIIFSGGGDPILSFSKLREAIEYAQCRASSQGITLNIGLVTNGSIMSTDQMEFIRKHKIEIVVSFDIIKEVHNLQRSHYEVVYQTIRTLLDNGISPGIRSTITPCNVNRQCEMVEELHRSFPEIKSAAFEAVLNAEMFDTSKALDNFYMAFIDNYFQAIDLGNKYGILIGNTIVNNTDVLKARACPGKLVLTPERNLTACSRISSPKEKLFSAFEYGSNRPGQIEINKDKYIRLMSHDVHHYNECSSCIAKWHCGGGCLLARASYSPQYQSAYCRFMQKMTVTTIKRKVSDNCQCDNVSESNPAHIQY